MKRIIIKAIAMLTLAAAVALSLSTGAAAICANVTIDGDSFCVGQTEIINDTTCVPFRAFIEKMTGGNAVIWWDDEDETAYAEFDGITVSAKMGEHYIVANGRYIWCGTETYLSEGTTYTAVRPLAKIFGAEVTWQEQGLMVTVGNPNESLASGDEYYDAVDLFWLSRIISAESKGEPLEGKLAVGAVIYNRLASVDYPDTLYGVIFDFDNGIQFTPASTGSIYAFPTEESIIAAKLCMEGFIYDERIMFFCAVSIAETSWAGQNRPYLYTIGGHAFFA
ncbi:MAG: cell wall hydrolase [Firmicutes bacterium]|nr:cell wall hydrolase [Bacillota bacterium]